MIKYYVRERYRFFVVLTIDCGAPVIVAFVVEVDCGGRDAGGGGMETDLVSQRRKGKRGAHRPPPTHGVAGYTCSLRPVAISSRLIGLIYVLRYHFTEADAAYKLSRCFYKVQVRIYYIPHLRDDFKLSDIRAIAAILDRGRGCRFDSVGESHRSIDWSEPGARHVRLLPATLDK